VVENVNAPARRLGQLVLLQVGKEAQSPGHLSDLPPLLVLQVRKEFLDDRGGGVSDRDRRVEDHDLSLYGDAAEQHEDRSEPGEAAHGSTSYGWRHERSASPEPRTNASLTAGPSRHMSSCMLTLPASVSRSRLLRASNCSRA